MIASVHFENYRSLRDVTLRLGPLTVLVGPNGAGKSNVFRGLLGDGAGAVAWHGSGVAVIRVEPGPAEWMGGNWQVGTVRAFRLRLNPTALRRPSVAAMARVLAEDSANLPQVLDSLGRKAMEAYAAEFCRLVPVFGDVDVLPAPKEGHRQVVFTDRWRPGRQFQPEDVSDGTLYVAAFLAVARQLDRPAILCIEEPERGLHPWLLQEVIKLLRSLTEPAEGRPAMQVILATQSAELLDCVEPSEVRFVERSRDDGSTLIREVDTSKPGWSEAFATYRESLGAMWLAGGLGGVPGR